MRTIVSYDNKLEFHDYIHDNGIYFFKKEINFTQQKYTRLCVNFLEAYQFRYKLFNKRLTFENTSWDIKDIVAMFEEYLDVSKYELYCQL